MASTRILTAVMVLVLGLVSNAGGQIASNPSPADGATSVDTNVTISWTPGLGAELHTVYFGDNFDDVYNAAVNIPQSTTSFTPGPLERGKTYYWRVDEFDGVETHKGNVWSFTTKPFIPITDPSLVGWWKLDEGSGTRANDSSGHGNHGSLRGGPQWVAGKIGGALKFDGVDDFVVYSFDQAQTFANFSVAFWVKASSLGQPNYSGLFSGHYPNTAGFQFVVDGGYPGVYRINANTGVKIAFGTATTDWIHLALTAEGKSVNLYYNGNWASSGTLADSDIIFNQFAIGVNRNRSKWFAGTIDELRVYDHVLSGAHVQILAGRAQASDPYPYDGAIHENTSADLWWTPWSYAIWHDVYFGERYGQVNNGTGVTFQGTQTGTYFTVGLPGNPYPDGLIPGKTYYWRIDEKEAYGMKQQGEVWSFTVAPKTAYNPDPLDGAKFVSLDVTLSWSPGLGAHTHLVYFGRNFDEVNTGNGDTYKDSVGTTSYIPGPLELEKTYYWRVDEFDGSTTHKGEVWSFKTKPFIPITDPSLVGWWKLDEGSGAIAVDWSGHDNDGMLEGNPQWVEGYDGSALKLDGNDHVETGYTTDLPTWTTCAWVKSPQAPSGRTETGPIQRQRNYQMNWDHGDPAFRGAAALRVGGVWYPASFGTLGANTWYYLSATYNEQVLKAYKNGVLITSNTSPSGTPDSETESLKLGRHARMEKYFKGTIDDVRIYNKALTRGEIIQAMMRGDLLIAWNPSPGKNATVDIEEATPLSWSPGDLAAKHDVYFGTNRNAVASADTTTPGIYRGRRTPTSYTPPEELETGQTYYWRVDEYNIDATISRGRVWSFTTMADPLAKALDTRLRFTTGGSADWFSQTTTFYNDGDAVQSGDISDDQESWMQTTVSGTGTVKFYWMVSSEQDYDFLEFYIDGSLEEQISGLEDDWEEYWEQMTYTISTSGSHVLEWRYMKDSSTDEGSDCGWVDKVEWVTTP